MHAAKYNYVKVIQGYFAGYWEDVSEYEKCDFPYIKNDLKEYRKCSPNSYRVISRRNLKGAN